MSPAITVRIEQFFCLKAQAEHGQNVLSIDLIENDADRPIDASGSYIVSCGKFLQPYHKTTYRRLNLRE